MNLTEDDKYLMKTAKTCHICENNFKKDDTIVADHCHLTGTFRGPAHKTCNLNYRIDPKKYKVPIFFHNLKGYDSHFIFQEVDPNIHGQIKVIPKTREEYISFTIGDMVFKDSYAFMQASLDKLAEGLPKKEMIHTQNFIKQGVKSIKNSYHEITADKDISSGIINPKNVNYRQMKYLNQSILN